VHSAALIYNPAAGTKRNSRQSDVELARRVLSAAGIQTILAPTLRAGSATAQALELLQKKIDTLIVCGGDGTVNEVVQALASSGQGQLGLIPMGCGNLLAKELGIPTDPIGAARALLKATPQQIRVGIIEYQSADDSPARRHWIVAAGIGADAQVICNIAPEAKLRHGMRGYYLESMRYLMSDRGFRPFLVLEDERSEAVV